VTDLPGLIKQRVRWGRGVVQTGKKMHIFTSKDLSIPQKMNYWASIWYWYAPIKRLIYVLSPLVYGAFGIMVIKCTLPQVLIFWLPMYISSNISLRMLSGNIRNTKWTGIYETILFPFMLLPVLLETFGISLKTFRVSDKRNITGRKQRDILHLLPFVLLFALSVFALVRSIILMFQSNSFSSAVLVFWLLLNAFYLVMAMFFVDGRNIYRKAERVMVKLPAHISDARIALDCSTRDISETGISVLLDKPHYFTEDKEVDLVVSGGAYEARLKALIVFVDQRDDLWNYSMRITDYCGTYDDYLQLLYDRIPTLPQSIKQNSGSFDDLYLNSKKRITQDVFQKRHLARVQMQQSVPCPEAPGGAVTVSDFNYCFVNLASKVALPSELTLKPLEGLEIRCRTRNTATANGGWLYSVENRDELVNNEVTYNLLLQWLCGSTVNVEMNPEAGKVAEEKKKEFSEADLV
jgi:cellulose synthase (UDP-forming)